MQLVLYRYSEVLGWRVSDNAEEKVGPFFALLSARLMTGPAADA
jgi:hypothetical protein